MRERSPNFNLTGNMTSFRNMWLCFCVAVLSAGTATASYAANLNYRSPSHHHPSLGIAIHKVNKRNGGSPPMNASSLNFTHGVASGDPAPDSVILWTRCAPMLDDVQSNSTVSGYVPLYNPVPIYSDANGTQPASKSPVCVSFKVATDKQVTKIVDSGTAYTSSDVDYTLKVSDLTIGLIFLGSSIVNLVRSRHKNSNLLPHTITNLVSVIPKYRVQLVAPRLCRQQMTS